MVEVQSILALESSTSANLWLICLKCMYIYIYYIIYTFILAKTIFNRPIGFSIVNSFFSSVRAQLWLELAHITSSFHAIFQTRKTTPGNATRWRWHWGWWSCETQLFHERNLFTSFLTDFPHVYQCFPRDMNKNDGYHFDIFGNQPCLQGPHHYIMPYTQQSPFLDDFTHGVFGTKLFQTSRLSVPTSRLQATEPWGDLLPEAGNIAIKPSGSPRPPYQFLWSPPRSPPKPRCVTPGDQQSNFTANRWRWMSGFPDHSPSPSKWSCQLRKYSIPKMSHKVMAKTCQK